MSLTEDMSLLVSRANALLTMFDGKAAEINAAVVAALAATQETQKIVYVDPVNGVDTAVGDLNHPVLTVDRALDMVTNVRSAVVRLFGDVTMSRRHIMTGGNISFVGVERAATASGIAVTSRKMAIGPDGGQLWDQSTAVAGITQIGDGSILLDAIEVTIPTPAAAIAHKSVFTFAGTGTFGLVNCSIKAPAGTLARLMTVWNPHRVSLSVFGTTFDSNMPGRIVEGMAAGTDPNTSWALKSNITSV